MIALEIKDLGIRFQLHPSAATLREAVIRILTRRRAGITGLDDTHGEFWALRHANFRIAAGESVGIVGRNGAGKSTLLKVLAGIYRPDEGTISRVGRISLLQLGTGFHPELSGRENVYLSGAFLGLNKRAIDAHYDSIVRLSELGRFIDEPIKYYSSGMIARLGFATAIHIQPEVLLIDEVLAVGDESFKAKCLQELDKIKSNQKTIVLVSHLMQQVKELCERAICLDRGGIVFDGCSSDAAAFYRDILAATR